MSAEIVEAVESAWWTQRQSGGIGAVLGVVLGAVGGGLVGGVGIPLAVNYWRSKTIAYGLMIGFALTGLPLLCAGVYALVDQQPYHVWYPLLLTGGLLDAMGVWFIVMLHIRFRQMESQQMASDLIRDDVNARSPRGVDPLKAGAIATGTAAVLLGLSWGSAVLFLGL